MNFTGHVDTGFDMIYTVFTDKKANAAGVSSSYRALTGNTGMNGAAALYDSTRINLRRNPDFGIAPFCVLGVCCD